MVRSTMACLMCSIEFSDVQQAASTGTYCLGSVAQSSLGKVATSSGHLGAMQSLCVEHCNRAHRGFQTQVGSVCATPN